MTTIRWESRFIKDGEPLYKMVYHSIRHSIVSGQLSPGEHLPEEGICHYLKVSRTPVRMAILELEKEGLVSRRRGRTLVSGRVELERKESLEIRRELEMLAVSGACRNARPEDVESLRKLNGRFAAALRLGNAEESALADEQFHEEICRLSGNAVLSNMIREIEETIYGYRFSDCRAGSDNEEKIREHEEIIDAIADGREWQARESVRRHICGQRRAS